MRLVFAGTPEFAAVVLAALQAAGHTVVLALTQPDRPAGRGLKMLPSAVKRRAMATGVRISQPTSLKDPQLQAALIGESADAWAVAAYGVILPKALLDAPRFGCINVHASLLPRWRGAAPIQRAIMGGDAETGVSIMRMDEGLDTGPVFVTRPTPIGPQDTGESVHDRLATLGATAVCEVLTALAHGAVTPTPQPAAGVCYAPKLTRADATIDWTKTANEIERQVRALYPTPAAVTNLNDQPMKILGAVLGSARHAATPGEIVQAAERGIEVCCGAGTIIITHLQRAGSRRMSAAELLRGYKLPEGARFT